MYDVSLALKVVHCDNATWNLGGIEVLLRDFNAHESLMLTYFWRVWL
jgi:hypothetical protein